ncbi:hypothetical protein ACIRBX_34180 [Kitasatospora sp. NPDC096147]|uniref:hypothetical protein n=1 Tax=Kitasatospora sp. NPDC096147 TaxID=3364093 RepID=UPI003818237C
MTVFACRACGHTLTEDLRITRRAADTGNPKRRGRTGRLDAPPSAIEGTYREDAHDGELLLHPDDVPGTVEHPDDSRLNGCCGLDGQDGPNLVCAGCGAEVGTRQSDCWTPNRVLLIPAALRSPTG